ncbi:imidazoleglycerol-phosphate dehydratase isoform X2 [Amborella trichopoda]|uniref:imidazoleglycerol-phosphate dehydratase isoform X2 n=1 Tax=Amborella trichopoda TaxID=13333 RepID=UPI0009C0C552|nr:imidazoleglycerol-phosphate dehydratase isoform X2 [Amborella trichopoda]|eukprot:XP_020517328.1 imidazoleglycerol-phosphate dehydratase isoform X2 [Amborella trichopoda]
MRVVSALKLLGVSEGDEILRANTSILAACKDDQEASAQAFRFICCAATKARDNGSPIMTPKACRIGEVRRVTKETNVHVKINLDGSGFADNNTGIPFLDHMLDQLASHGPFDVCVKAQGDIHIDDHHTNEDVALAIGTDLSGRPHLSYDLSIPTERVGTYDTQLVEHFFQLMANTSGMTLHIRQLSGKNSHHIIEATFKAFARALWQATEYDVRRKGSIPSSKGVLSRF